MHRVLFGFLTMVVSRPSGTARESSRADGRVRSFERIARVVVLGLTDIAFLFLAVSVAYVIWARPMREQSLSLYFELSPLVSLFILGYAQAGLYPGIGLGPVETLKRFSYVTSFGFLVLAAFSFALKLPHLYSRVTFGLAFALSLALVPIGRSVLLRLASRWPWWREPVAIVGSGQRASNAIRALRHSDHLGYQPVAVLALDSQDRASEVDGVPIVGGVEHSRSLAERGVRVALLESDRMQDRAVVERLLQDFRHVVLLRDYDDLPVEGLQIRNLGNLVGVEYTNNLLLRRNQIVKRALDLAIASLALVILTPVIVCSAALVRLVDRGPALFLQIRRGLGGRRIAVPKIRTMRLDAEMRLEEYLEASPSLRQEWQERYKLRHDPRLLPMIGWLFRRFSVDELPQLWAVFTGEMSLVGPRPLPDYHVERFPPEFLALRDRVRPGITGLWQVTMRGDAGVEAQQAYDSYYIRNWSVWLDVYLLSRTVAAVLTGRGAY